MPQLPTLQQVQNLPDAAPSWHWILRIIRYDEQIIDELYASQIQLPFSYLQVNNVYRAGAYLYFPGTSNVDGINVSFYETENYDVFQLIQPWRDKVRDPDGNYNMPKDYLGTMSAWLFDNQGRCRIEVDLFGCWPHRVDPWTLDYTNSNHLTLTVEFSVNAQSVTFFRTDGSQTNLPQLPTNSVLPIA